MAQKQIKGGVLAVGIVSGIALFVAGGLFLTIGANRGVPMTPAPLPALAPAVVAPAEQLGRAFAAVAARIKPAVVSVYSQRMVLKREPQFSLPFGNDLFGQMFGNEPQRQQQLRVPESGLGSGMILDREGDVLTNYHVIKGFTHIQIRLPDGRRFDAAVVGTDPKTDVAVIRIKGTVPSDLPTVQLGDSDAMKDGNLVLAVGAPFGLTQTVTNGIISATGRSNLGIADFEDFLQTDAPINPGNSGGPLVNMQGQVIGMNSAILTDETEGGEGQFGGVGFAIPVNMIKAMLPTLLRGGKIVRGMIGVVIQEITPELARQFHLPSTQGALVSQVSQDSPAAQAGIKSGDDIVRYDAHAILDVDELRNLVAATTPGTRVPVQLIRDGKQQTFTVTVAELRSSVAAAVPSRTGADELTKFGISAQTLTPGLASQYGLSTGHGVVITQVEQGSPASLAGLQPGDVIVQADRKPVSSVDALDNAVAGSDGQILLLISRNGTEEYVTLAQD